MCRVGIAIQWSNYSIIYEGGRKIWRAIASLEKKICGPEAPPEVTFREIKMFFYCNFSTKIKHLQIATRKCTLWRCKSTPTPKAKLLWMT